MRSIRWFGCVQGSALCVAVQAFLWQADATSCSMNYNHALCVWRPAALARIYSLAVEHLVQQRHYPDSILHLKCVPPRAPDIGTSCAARSCAVGARRYDPDFLIRGVSLDTHRGIVVKLTCLHTVTPSEPTSARRGAPLGDVAGVARGASAGGRPRRGSARRAQHDAAAASAQAPRSSATAA